MKWCKKKKAITRICIITVVLDVIIRVEYIILGTCDDDFYLTTILAAGTSGKMKIMSKQTLITRKRSSL